MKTTLMLCGCSRSGEMLVKGEWTPSCVVHGETRLMDPLPDLTGRKARCTYGCTSECKPSNVDLPFFEYRPKQEYDRYYCGCRGFD